MPSTMRYSQLYRDPLRKLLLSGIPSSRKYCLVSLPRAAAFQLLPSVLPLKRSKIFSPCNLPGLWFLCSYHNSPERGLGSSSTWLSTSFYRSRVPGRTTVDLPQTTIRQAKTDFISNFFKFCGIFFFSSTADSHNF